MKESLYNVDSECIYRLSMGSEDECRMFGAVPTNVVFNNGVATFNGSTTTFNIYKILNGTYSVRIKFKSITLSSGKSIVDCRTNGGSGVIYTDTSSTIKCDIGGTVYINGVATTTITANENDLVITGIPFSKVSLVALYNINYPTIQSLACSIELFEIYKGTLSSTKVSLLYANRSYKPVLPHTEVLGVEKITNGDMELDSSWLNYQNPTINERSNVKSYSGTYSRHVIGSGDNTGIYQSVGSVNLGSVYRVVAYIYVVSGSVKITRTQGFLPSVIGEVISTTGSWIPINVLIVGIGTGTENIKIIQSGSTTAEFYIDNISVREVISTANLILDVSALNGVVRNRLSGNTNGVELVANGTFSSDTGWTKADATVTIHDGAVYFSNSPSGSNLYQNLSLVATADAKSYLIIYTLNISSGSITPRIGNTSASGITRTASGTFTETLIKTGGASPALIFGNGVNTTATIDNVSVQEIIPAVINTNVLVRRSGGIWAMVFNGVDSKLDCGSYNGLTGDVTICVWIKSRDAGGATNGRILDNSKLTIFHNGVNILVCSDGSSNQGYAANIRYGNYYHLVLTRLSNGSASLYINSVLIATNTTTNLSSGSNILIGNNSTANRGENGEIASVKAYQGILSSAEISNIYVSEKQKFGL